MAGKIFINYRRVESRKDAQLLKAELDKEFGDKHEFLDVRGIEGGENWLQTLERQVADSAAMVVLIGNDWIDHKDEHGNRRLDNPNDKVRFEISQALLRNLPIIPIPVTLDSAPMPKATQLPDNLWYLTLKQSMPLRSESVATDAEAIAKQLKALMAKLEQRRAPIWATIVGLFVAFCAGAATLIMSILLGLLPLTVISQKEEAEMQAATAALVANKERAATEPLRSEIATLQRQLDEARQGRSSVTPQRNAPLPPHTKLGADEIATKISIWESVSGSNLNALIGAYNALDLAQSKWTQLVKSADGRRQLYQDLINADANFVGASTDLETLRSAYQNYPEVTNALAQQPLISALHKATLDFANSINKEPAAETQLRPLAGTLRREMDAVQMWMHDLQVTANEQHKMLLDIK
jgi:hypothetical protein